MADSIAYRIGHGFFARRAYYITQVIPIERAGSLPRVLPRFCSLEESAKIHPVPGGDRPR